MISCSPRRAHFRLLASGLTILLAGCRALPVPISHTASWTPPPDAQRADTVWHDTRAENPAPSHPLTLAELVDLALQHNPASRLAWNEARVAAAQIERARGSLEPNLTGTVAANRSVTSAEPAGFDKNQLKYGPALQLHYLLMNFGGGRKAALEVALRTAYAADYAFNRRLQDILLATETAYYGVISAQAGVAAAEASVTNALAVRTAAEARKAAGTGTELEVLQARTTYDQSLFLLASAQGLSRGAEGVLAQTLGVPADMPVPVAELSTNVPPPFPAKDLRKTIDEALARRPDLAALRAAWDAREATVKVEGASLWPSLYFDGSVARDYYSGSDDMPSWSSDWAYGAGLSLKWNLLDGRQSLSAKHAARAAADAAYEQLKQAELAASAEVWTRYYAYETAQKKYTFSVAALGSASAAYELALESYKAGLKSVLDVLSAESQLAQARQQQVTARQEAFTALAGFAHATGLLAPGNVNQTEDLFSTETRKDQQP